MNDLRERGGNTRRGFLSGRLPSPLPQKFPVAIEHRDAAVAVTVGDVNVAVRGIDHNGRGIKKLGLAGIQSLAFGSAVSRVENTALADLKQKFPIVAVFLDDAVAIAGEPDIVVAIGETAMDHPRNRVPVPVPGINQISR